MTQEDRFDDGDVAFLAWFEKTRINNPEVAIRGRELWRQPVGLQKK
jgi:hypothetical protein